MCFLPVWHPEYIWLSFDCNEPASIQSHVHQPVKSWCHAADFCHDEDYIIVDQPSVICHLLPHRVTVIPESAAICKGWTRDANKFPPERGSARHQQTEQLWWKDEEKQSVCHCSFYSSLPLSGENNWMFPLVFRLWVICHTPFSCVTSHELHNALRSAMTHGQRALTPSGPVDGEINTDGDVERSAADICPVRQSVERYFTLLQVTTLATALWVYGYRLEIPLRQICNLWFLARQIKLNDSLLRFVISFSGFSLVSEQQQDLDHLLNTQLAAPAFSFWIILCHASFQSLSRQMLSSLNAKQWVVALLI